MRYYDIALKALERAREKGLSMDRWAPLDSDSCCFAGHLARLPEACKLGMRVGETPRLYPSYGSVTKHRAIAAFLDITAIDGALLTGAQLHYYAPILARRGDVPTQSNITIEDVREALDILHKGGTLRGSGEAI